MKRSRSFLRFRRGARDANHAAIRDGLRALGHLVLDMAGVGDGIPDLCVYPRHVNGSEPVWLELKVAKGKLRESQTALHAIAPRFGMRVAVVRSLDEALAAVSS